ncbi:MAG: hypothetical protein ACKV2O_23635 [Acidimicrobiales bacterium]
MRALSLAFITIDGVDFNIFMRGLLVVGIGVAVLMGSVYILLATNSGLRTGFMLAATGFFGWMFIMGAIWTIYGIGYQGRLPAWKVVEMNRGDLSAAQFAEAAKLGADLQAAAGEEGPAAALVESFAAGEEAQEAPEVAGWTGLLASNRSRGEAQATADAFLLGRQEFAAGSYMPVGAFEIGGKDKRPDAVCRPRVIGPTLDGCPERAWHRIKIALTPRHPAHYAAVMVQAATPQSLTVRPGEAPPTRAIDQNQPLYTIIMERDLGSKRVPPANIMLGSGVIFGALCWRLHRRDAREAAARAAYATAS